MFGMAKTTLTTDHQVIRRWIEKRGGMPGVALDQTPTEGAGVLRVQFPGSPEDRHFAVVSWSEFFERFEQSHLAFLIEEGEGDSFFFKFISRDGE
ncbi:MAG: hypothetical protein GX089_10385 [Fibrobacter sp.]|nr:hypothetical protein [Fibrobacter sp.]